MVHETSDVVQILRKENYHFRTLEKMHTQLEESLEGMNRRKVLSPREELQKKTYQKEKLAAKDSMEKIIRHYLATGDADFKVG